MANFIVMYEDDTFIITRDSGCVHVQIKGTTCVFRLSEDSCGRYLGNTLHCSADDWLALLDILNKGFSYVIQNKLGVGVASLSYINSKDFPAGSILLNDDGKLILYLGKYHMPNKEGADTIGYLYGYLTSADLVDIRPIDNSQDSELKCYSVKTPRQPNFNLRLYSNKPRKIIKIVNTFTRLSPVYKRSLGTGSYFAVDTLFEFNVNGTKSLIWKCEEG